MSKLYCSKFGHGPDLALLHGWGSSSKIWLPSIHELSPKFHICCVDLPGHGDSHAIKWDGTTQQGVELLAQCLPRTCSIIAWSLGGLLAQLYVQQFPQRVTRLMLIASTAKFVACPQWSHGMQRDIFTMFSQQYANNPQQTLKKFCALQVLNTKQAKHTLSVLTHALSNQPKHIGKIQWGLQWLQNIDLRADATLAAFPIKLVHGEKDRVLSVLAAQHTARLWKNTELVTIKNAGHAPFISHTKRFLQHIAAWHRV